MMMMDTVNACAQLLNLKKGKKLQVKPGKLESRTSLVQNTTCCVTLRGLSVRMFHSLSFFICFSSHRSVTKNCIFLVTGPGLTKTPF